jgi:hypothetical protein
MVNMSEICSGIIFRCFTWNETEVYEITITSVSLCVPINNLLNK